MKFGGRVVLGFQSIAQLSGLCGDSESRLIVENCANTLILRCSASERAGTARFASRLIDEREIIRGNVTKNRNGSVFARRRESISRNLQHVVETAVLLSEIEHAPDFSGYLNVGSRHEWLRVRLALSR